MQMLSLTPPPLSLQVNDRVNEEVCRVLEEGGVKYIALRCAGFDKVGAARAVQLAQGQCRAWPAAPHSPASCLSASLPPSLHLHC